MAIDTHSDSGKRQILRFQDVSMTSLGADVRHSAGQAEPCESSTSSSLNTIRKLERDAAVLMEERLSELRIVALSEIRSGLADSINQFLTKSEKLERECRNGVLHLALNVASEVVATTLDEIPDSIRLRMEKVLSQIFPQGHVAIFAHPEDIEFLKPLAIEVPRAEFRFGEDTQIERGAFRMEIDSVCLESNPFAHLERIKKTILGAKSEAK